MAQNKVDITVEIENLNGLIELSKKLKEQAFEIDKTINEISLLDFKLKINQ